MRIPAGVAGMCVGRAPDDVVISGVVGARRRAHGAAVRAACRFGATASGDAHVHSAGSHAAHLAGVAMSPSQTTALLATLLHTLSYVAVSGAIAYVVYQHFGLRFLRRAWINMNVIWGALIVTAVATPLV